MLWMVLIPSVSGQNLFNMADPLLQDESPKRAFFSRFTGTGFFAYRPGYLPVETAPAAPPSSFTEETTTSTLQGVDWATRVDYAVANEVDVFGIVGQTRQGRGNLTLGWVGAKYYHHSDEGMDYAFRLAAQPGIAAGGFPQVDVGLFTVAPFFPETKAELALNLRHSRFGFMQQDTPNDPFLLTSIRGQELNIVRTYRLLLDPAESNLFVALVGTARYYNRVETFFSARKERNVQVGPTETIAGGHLGLRIGLQIQRPVWRFIPYVFLPLRTFGEPNGQVHLGASLQIR